MKFRIRYADRLVGSFVVLAALAMLAIIGMAGASQRWFARDARYVTVLDSASAAAPGAGIFMRGFQIGKIETVKLDESNQVNVRFLIYEDYKRLVRTNSVIEIVTSPIGLGTQILFHPGKGTGVLPEDSIIPEANSAEGRAFIEGELVDIPKKDDTVTRLLSGVNPLIENTSKAVASLNRTLTEINAALSGEGSSPVASIVDDAAGTVAGINDFVDNANKTVESVSAGVNGLVARVDQVAANLDAVSANLATLSAGLSDPRGLVPRLLDPKGSLKTLLDDDNALFSSLEKSIADIEKAAIGLASVTNSLSAEVPGIAATILEIRDTVREARDVVQSLKNNPLLRGGIPPKPDQPAVFQSLREGMF